MTAIPASRFTVTPTQDGTFIGHDPATEITTRGCRTADEARAELRRMILAAQQKVRAA